MEYDELGDQDVVLIRPPEDQGYRTRSEFGSDCEPDHSISNERSQTWPLLASNRRLPCLPPAVYSNDWIRGLVRGGRSQP
ncbi:hypothetical protein ACUXMN_001919 [Micrococcus yunnanensis]